MNTVLLSLRVLVELAVLSAACVVASASPATELEKAAALLGDGKAGRALAVLSPLQDRPNLGVTARLELYSLLGYTHEALGDPEVAAQSFARGVAEARRQGAEVPVRVVIGLARARLEARDARGALDALEAYPWRSRLEGQRQLLVAQALSQLGDRHAAEKLLRSAAAEGSPEACYSLGVVLFDGGRHAEALPFFDAALDCLGGDYYLRIYRARTFLELDRPEMTLRELGGLQPETAEVHHLRGTARLRRSELAEAEKEFRRALVSSPDYTEAVFGLATVLRRSGQVAEARETFRRFQTLHRQSREYARRRDSLLQLSYRQPKDADLHGRLGRLLLEGGELQGAEDHFWRALLVAPDSNPNRLGLARVLRQTGRYQAASIQYKKILARDPDHSLAREELEALVRKGARRTLLPAAQR